MPLSQKNQNIKQKQCYNKLNKDFKNDPHQREKKKKGLLGELVQNANSWNSLRDSDPIHVDRPQDSSF